MNQPSTRFRRLSLLCACLLFSPSTGAGENVTVEMVRHECPVMVREAFNPALGLRIVCRGTEAVKLEETELSLEGTTRPGDIREIHLIRGAADPSGGRIGEVARATEIGATTVLKGLGTMPPGEHWLWVSPLLRDDADPDGLISFSVRRMRFSGRDVTPAEAPPLPPQRIGHAVRLPGDDGVASYRIPGLVRSKAGTLVAVYDIRRRGHQDLPADIDVGVSRSTDGGRSWGPMIVAMDMGADPEFAFDGVGDPAVLSDPRTGRLWLTALWSHGKRGWQGSGPGLSPEETGQLVLCHSDDDGLTWSAPRNLTAQLKDPAWRLFFNGPGAGVALENGVLAFAAQYRAADGVPWSTMISSADGGRSWQVGTGVKSDTTEAQLAQLADGSVMINCRDNRGGSRTVAVTRDLGKTWRPHPSDRSALPEPVCMASLLAWDHPAQGRFLAFSNPDSTRSRHRMTVKLSTDEGMTWPERHHRLYDSRRGFGYSCLAPVDERRLGVLYETAGGLYFLRLPLAEWFGGSSIP